MEWFKHYKKKLLCCIDDPDKVMYCLKKLDARPVTVEILQDLEIAKAVSRLRKRSETLSQDVISSSKELLNKWRKVVKDKRYQKAPKLTVDEVKFTPKYLSVVTT